MRGKRTGRYECPSDLAFVMLGLEEEMERVCSDKERLQDLILIEAREEVYLKMSVAVAPAQELDSSRVTFDRGQTVSWWMSTKCLDVGEAELFNDSEQHSLGYMGHVRI
jgi:hypothetical protein